AVTLALLEAVRAHGAERLVFSSTAATYGEPAAADPIPETAPAVPSNPYVACKLHVDPILSSWSHAPALVTVSLRYFNLPVTDLGFGERHDPETHLIPNLLRVANGESPHASLHGTDHPTPDGTAVRDYLHVADLADAHLRALERLTPGTHRVYNLGTG